MITSACAWLRSLPERRSSDPVFAPCLARPLGRHQRANSQGTLTGALTGDREHSQGTCRRHRSAMTVARTLNKGIITLTGSSLGEPHAPTKAPSGLPGG
jgi:hypothetical protein